MIHSPGRGYAARVLEPAAVLGAHERGALRITALSGGGCLETGVTGTVSKIKKRIPSAARLGDAAALP